MSEMVKRRRTGGHAISGFFVFCLIGLFALLATTLTLVGIRAYRNVYTASVSNSEGQIALSYLENKVHAHDRENGIRIEKHGQTDVLCLLETFDSEDYETRIYYMGGSLREYYCEAGEPFDSDMGEELTALDGMSMELVSPNVLLITVHIDGNTRASRVALRAGEVALK